MTYPPLTLFRSAQGLVAQRGEDLFRIERIDFDDVFRSEKPAELLHDRLASGIPMLAEAQWLAPIQSQEVWAAGVTYLRSRDARMEESKDAGGGSFYDRVYDADRPEIFFKATPHRVVGSGGEVRIRADSKWNVPEPELTLAINRSGAIFGYTIGNDMSSRDIEGENPLYLPQAKVYRGCCGLGPGLVVREPLPESSAITIRIMRSGETVFSGETSLSRMKRKLPELAEWLTREDSFPNGCYLLTGTGVVPPNEFTLAAGDEIQIGIDGVGTLVNRVAALDR
jgi:2-dehydro-3-deoxy-D-arabinonate dehydratase